MIKFAEDNMIPMLAEIWKECFEEEEREFEMFFQTFDVKKTVLILTDLRGEPISMIALLPAFLETKEGCKKAAYLYGLGTKREYRNQGYATKLLKSSTHMVFGDHAVPFLCPARESLVSFYKKMGYIPISQKELQYVERSEFEKNNFFLQSKDITVEEYEELRNKSLQGKTYVRWTRQSILYGKRVNALHGGKFRKLIYKDKEYGVLYRVSGRKICILEITETELEKAKEIVGAFLNSTLEIQTAEIHRSVFAMSYGYEENEKLWMNLAMG